ncbi:MAG: SAV_6107 family HEPN domain-containing protein, partial [bacterium]
ATSMQIAGPAARVPLSERPERGGAPVPVRRRPATSRHEIRRGCVRPSGVAGLVPATAAPTRSARSSAGVTASALAQSRALLADARREVQASDRFRLAHLAALRAAAALLSVHAEAGSSRRRPQSAWTLIEARVPRFHEWAAYFAAGARARAAAEAGLRDAVTPARAAELIDAAELFLFLVAAEVRADGPVDQAVIPPPAAPVQADRAVAASASR